jgi:hypothetical protein
MKRLLLAMVLIFALVGSFAFADTRQKHTIGVYTSSTLIKRGDAKVYRIDYIVTSNGGGWAIYDGLSGDTEANAKTEGSEATALNGKPYDFNADPIECSTGLYLWINNATVIVTYD